MVAFVVAFLMVVNTSLTAYASGPDELSKKSDDYSMDYNYEGNTLYNSDVITASMYSVENGNDDMIKPNSISIAALSAAIMAILAEHGASFQAGVIIGQFCKNNGINYWVGQGALFAATALFIPTYRAAVMLGYDKGYKGY